MERRELVAILNAECQGCRIAPSPMRRRKRKNDISVGKADHLQHVLLGYVGVFLFVLSMTRRNQRSLETSHDRAEAKIV